MHWLPHLNPYFMSSSFFFRFAAMNSLKTLNNLDEVEGMEDVIQTRSSKRLLNSSGGVDSDPKPKRAKRTQPKEKEGMGNNGDIGFL